MQRGKPLQREGNRTDRSVTEWDSTMANGEPALRFRVDWGGRQITFAEINGLRPGAYGSAPIGRLEQENSARASAGKTKYDNITFRNGVVNSDEYVGSVDLEFKRPERCDVTVTLLAEGEEAVMVWKVSNALLVKVASPHESHGEAGATIDLLEISHEGIEVMTANS